VLFHGGKLLLLKRAAWKKFAPNRWTGIGGKVEPTELGDLGAAARRELFEETDFAPDEIVGLTFRRTLTFFSADEGLVTLLYFTGRASSLRVPSCNEGTLAWIDPSDLPSLDLVQNTGVVLLHLIEDEATSEQVIHCGVGRLDRDGNFIGVIFSE
jgi:8-oxo-dGTP diphosphatase